MNDSKRVADVAELVRSLLPGGSRSFALLAMLPIGVFVLDHDGRQLYANHAVTAILGRRIEPGTSAEERAAFFHAYVAGTDDPYPPDRLPSMRALRGERVHVMDMEIRGPSRRVIVDIA